MTETTIFLRFDDRAAALAALAPFGLVEAGDFRETARPDGARVDLRLLGGDGVCRRIVGATTVEDPEIGSVEIPDLAVVAGFHVNLSWRGDAPPDFAAAAVAPATPRETFAA